MYWLVYAAGGDLLIPWLRSWEYYDRSCNAFYDTVLHRDVYWVDAYLVRSGFVYVATGFV